MCAYVGVCKWLQTQCMEWMISESLLVCLVPLPYFIVLSWLIFWWGRFTFCQDFTSSQTPSSSVWPTLFLWCIFGSLHNSTLIPLQGFWKHLLLEYLITLLSVKLNISIGCTLLFMWWIFGHPTLLIIFFTFFRSWICCRS